MNKPTVFFLSIIVSIQISAQPSGLFKLTSSSNVQDLNIPGLFLLQNNYLEKIYYSSVTAPNELINGKEYLPYYWRSGTNPLLFVNRNRTATLFFQYMEIKNLSLQYDTYLDEVIYTDNTRTVNGQLARIALNKYNLKGFNLYFDYDSIMFRYFRFPAEYSEKMKDGFYEVAYDGRSQFLIKHRSTLYNKEGLDKYGYSPEKYIFSGDAWIKVGSRKSFMKVFGAREKEMSEMLHKSKIRIQRAGKGQIAEILKYFDSHDNSGK
jgi:hypothetical protein